MTTAPSQIIHTSAAGGLPEGKAIFYTITTTSNSYEVVNTIVTSQIPGMGFTASVAGNNLLMKLEVSKDSFVWSTIVEDYPCNIGYTQFYAQFNAYLVRVSIKPAVAGAHGTATIAAVFNNIVLPPEVSYAFGYESKTVTNASAISLTQSTYDAARVAMITVEDNPIRVRWDGTAPTTSEGHLLQSGDTLELRFSADIFHFRAIATGTNATIRVTYSR